jgi:hypothetical protein
VLQALQVLLAQQALQVLLAQQALLDQQALQVLLAQQDPPVLLVLQDQQVLCLYLHGILPTVQILTHYHYNSHLIRLRLFPKVYHFRRQYLVKKIYTITI